MTHRRPAALAALAAVTALAAPAAAHGAAFATLKPCYVSLPGEDMRTEAINLAGTGFTPGAKVDVAIDGDRAISGATADAAGNIGGDPANPLVAGAPYLTRGERNFQIVATEQGADAPAASQTTRVTALQVSLSPSRAKPSSRVRFRGRGFTGPGKVYAHYRFKGKTRKTVRFSQKGACGTFSSRKRQIPVSNPGTGRWSLQFDQQKKYARVPESVFVRLAIDVTRTVRYNRAAMSRAAAFLTTARGF